MCHEISLGEVVSNAQNRKTQLTGKSINKAVAQIESRLMASVAEPAPSFDGALRHSGIKVDNTHVRVTNESRRPVGRGRPQFAFEHDAQFDICRGRHQSSSRLCKNFSKPACPGFAIDYGERRRGVNNDWSIDGHVGKPCSS